MAEANYVDPTNVGLMLIGIIACVFGVLGVLIFAKSDAVAALAPAADMLAMFFGFALILYSVFCASRTGDMPCMMAFGFVGCTLAAIGYSGITGIATLADSYVMLIILAFVFLIYMFLMLFVGAPKILVGVFLWAFLFFLFFGLYVSSPSTEIYSLLFGVFGALTGIFAIYLGFAEATGKLPVV